MGTSGGVRGVDEWYIFPQLDGLAVSSTSKEVEKRLPAGS